MCSIVQKNNKKKTQIKPNRNTREHLIPKAFSLKECCNWKCDKKQSTTKIKVNVNNNEREMKFNYLALPENIVNILTVRKDAFNLTNNYNFSHDEALSLLSPAYFKEQLLKIYNRQQGNLHR